MDMLPIEGINLVCPHLIQILNHFVLKSLISPLVFYWMNEVFSYTLIPTAMLY